LGIEPENGQDLSMFGRSRKRALGDLFCNVRPQVVAEHSKYNLSKKNKTRFIFYSLILNIHRISPKIKSPSQKN
jgi:hypothetical protein